MEGTGARARREETIRLLIVGEDEKKRDGGPPVTQTNTFT